MVTTMTMLKSSSRFQSWKAFKASWEETLIDAKKYADLERMGTAGEKVHVTYRLLDCLANRLLQSSLRGKKMHMLRPFFKKMKTPSGDIIVGLEIHERYAKKHLGSARYWEWVAWRRFMQLLLDAQWATVDNRGGLISLEMKRLCYMRDKKTKAAIIKEGLFEQFEDNLLMLYRSAKHTPKVKYSFIVDDTRIPWKDPRLESVREQYVLKAIRRNWRRAIKGLFLAHGKGFTAQQGEVIYANAALLNDPTSEVRDFLIFRLEKRYEAKPKAGEIKTFDKSQCALYNALGIRAEGANWELDAYKDGGIVNGVGMCDIRERFYHNPEHLFPFAADRVFRAILDVYPGWSRKGKEGQLLIAGAKMKLARNLKDLKAFVQDPTILDDASDLTEDLLVAKVEVLLDEWRKTAPKRPQPPKEADGTFSNDRSRVNHYAEQLWYWRIIVALLEPDDKLWTVPIEWDAHASFSGLYGATCHCEDYLAASNCLAMLDRPFSGFYNVSAALSRLEKQGILTKGSKEETWARANAKGICKFLYIPAHYAARFAADMKDANTVDNPFWGLLLNDKGTNLPKDIIDQMVLGGLEAFEKAKQETKEKYRKVELTWVGKLMVNLVQELIDDLLQSPIIKFIETIKDAFKDVNEVEKNIDFGRWGSILMQTHKPVMVYDEDDHVDVPKATSRPEKWNIVAYTKAQKATSVHPDKLAWVGQGVDTQDKFYSKCARKDTFLLQTNRVATWIPTGLIHHLDAVFADLASYVLIKKYGYCLSIHDAFITSPAAYWLLNELYGKFLRLLWRIGPSLWDSVFEAFDIPAKAKETPGLFQDRSYPQGFCRTFK